jgi:CCR4-NOT transcription complex subunit 1
VQSSSINWAEVIKAFDIHDRSGVDTATLKLLINILINAPRDADIHAVDGFWSTWRNALYQLRLLDALLSLPADTFNFVTLPGRRIVTMDDVANASPTIKALAANVQGSTWNSLDLFEVLVRLADSEQAEVRGFVREMLDKAVRISAELVHMGLLEAPVSLQLPHDIIILIGVPWVVTCSKQNGMRSAPSTRRNYSPCFWLVIRIINWSL